MQDIPVTRTSLKWQADLGPPSLTCISFPYDECDVPENIHTPPLQGQFSWFEPPPPPPNYLKIQVTLRISNDLSYGRKEGRGGEGRGGEGRGVQIFSGAAQQVLMITDFLGSLLLVVFFVTTTIILNIPLNI